MLAGGGLILLALALHQWLARSNKVSGLVHVLALIVIEVIPVIGPLAYLASTRSPSLNKTGVAAAQHN